MWFRRRKRIARALALGLAAAAIAAPAAQGLIPSDMGGGVSRTQSVSPDDGQPQVREPIAATVSATGDSFDWADAGVGVAFAVGLLLLATAGALALRNRRPAGA
jgi:hypothetical protein